MAASGVLNHELALEPVSWSRKTKPVALAGRKAESVLVTVAGDGLLGVAAAVWGLNPVVVIGAQTGAAL